MPRMTGLEFLAQAKVLRPEATRILITAVLNLGTVIEAINQGEIYRFIVKPWLREEFLGAITSAVERYRLVSGHALQRGRADEAVQERDSLLLRVRAVEEQREAAQRRATQERDRTRALAQAMLSRYDVTLGDRTRRVATLCRDLGTRAGLGPAEQEALEDAGWYHDLGCLGMDRGLVGIGPEVLNNLDVAQRREWEAHPRRSAELLADVGWSGAVQAAVEVHHERHDGSGTPQGLSGDSIPRLGRLLAVAVAYVEGGSDRRAALTRIQERAGKAFDLEAVRCLEQSVAALEAADPMPV
jgi:response regulator RpfG family c-di-GMP phosphodiesterase